MMRNLWREVKKSLKSEQRHQRHDARATGFQWIILLGVKIKENVKDAQLFDLTSSRNTR